MDRLEPLREEEEEEKRERADNVPPSNRIDDDEGPTQPPAEKQWRNAKGGVYVDKEELRSVFEFFDADNKGYITKNDLKDKLPLFYTNLKAKEYQYLMNRKNKLTFDDLYELLADNDLVDFDPVAEAFQFYDPQGKGHVQPNVLTKLLTELGLGPITQNDLQMLIHSSDVDGDGHVNINDFRQMLATNPFDQLEALGTKSACAAAKRKKLPATTKSARR